MVSRSEPVADATKQTISRSPDFGGVFLEFLDEAGKIVPVTGPVGRA